MIKACAEILCGIISGMIEKEFDNVDCLTSTLGCDIIIFKFKKKEKKGRAYARNNDSTADTSLVARGRR